ncbi:MAG: hypothetical protein UX71_C0002G0186 [Parcubacteria group bacterium GW2011_GWA1_47_10]|uniref:Uncharacterized protein n=1 Tax=Candidatus Zambryskibacteria bacterium RIFCSPHIGHO2_01_FULL_46_25 TaxID=1802738 RepID=A0A1G2SZC7_9BACT|nr:MAG: hypothetical protein UX71_C0002G0186 [Parcubacteria group bacterium GW2011_GWA1_47_10]OHA90098.1 MAG: hypothetical protein A2838_00500 [Candidatus Zambryskibacteria bacterium RIFCSPHIGHO2_01_FULL_46_25]OHB06527.1 MAG: hypothetical protein A3A31_02755 [Candidatus Zambryskibacteria bacterium RIFCSPLOWO2_01_FULL_48_25]
MTSIRQFFVVVALVVMTSACSKSPSGPSQVPPGPTPFPGTSIQTVPLSENQTFKFWIISATPAIGGQLVVGQKANIAWTGSGPSVFHACVRSIFILEGVAEEHWSRIGGMAINSSADIPLTAGRSIDVDDNTPNVVSFKWYIWVSTSPIVSVGDCSNRDPDFTIKQTLNWRAPAK